MDQMGVTDEQQKKGKQITKEKISTGIEGLDRLFFGGIQLQNMGDDHKPLIIGIYGSHGTSKALLAIQLLHGLTKGLRNCGKEIDFDAPVFLTERNTVANLNDLLLDTLMSKLTSQIIKDSITGEYEWNVCEFCACMFDLENANNCCLPNNVPLDSYLGEDALYYNNRTNALHIRKPGDVEGQDNLIAVRRHDSINEYVKEDKNGQLKIPKRFKEDFFDVEVVSCDIKSTNNKENETTKEYRSGYIPCLVLDGCGTFDKRNYTEKLGVQGIWLGVLILLSDKEADISAWRPDISIELRTYQDMDVNYMYYQLRIHKSALQTSAVGWHQYKIRDYGFEVYPSSHVILQKRRYMPRALLRTHSSILSETFQQYLCKPDDRNKLMGFNEPYDPKLYMEYRNTREKREMDRLSVLYASSQPKDGCYSILEKIIFHGSKNRFPESTVSAFIGYANTYKRYLTSGGTFRSCCNREHVLNVLLDKEDYIMLHQITCPVLAFNMQKNHADKTVTFEKYIGEHKLENCRKCYQYIHFMDIRMGCISSDEFFYYLIQQLKVPIKVKGDVAKPISKIVIDDLQKLDFSFPLLKKDPLFLTTLIAICKDYHVDLFILCDEEAQFAKELRTQADNVICTKRDKDNNLSVYIERCAGYNNPNQAFACEIKEVKGLFQCVWKNGSGIFDLDERKIIDIE